MKQAFQPKSVLSKLSWHNNKTFILTIHKFDASSIGMKSGIFTEDYDVYKDH
jgi:hypothetical protein